MMYSVYAIYDELAGQFSKPFVLDSRIAQRNFRWMMQEMKPQDCEDKIIYAIGKYNDDSGEIISQKPEAVYDLQSAKEAEKNG